MAKESLRVIDLANFDKSTSPKDNFYRYVNGSWLDKNEIPPEYSRWGAFEELIERNYENIRSILEDCRAAVQKNEISKDDAEDVMHTKLVGIMYATGMDEDAVEKHGMKPMKDVYEAIDKVKSPGELFVLSAKLQREFGIREAGFWSFYATPDSKNSKWMVAKLAQYKALGIGDRDFYLKDEKKEIRDKYVAHVERMLKLTGITDGAAEKAKELMDLEVRIAESCMTRTEHRDPHKTYNKFATIEELGGKTKSTNVPWKEYFAALGLEGDFGGIIIDNPKLAECYGELLTSVDLETWKMYVRYHVTRSMASYLCKSVVDESFSFHGKDMTGQAELKPRWKRISGQVGQLVEESLGIKYVARHFSPEAKKVCKEMVDILTEVLRKRIEEIEWMQSETKQRAHRKLDTFRAKIGYPDKWEVEHCPALEQKIDADASYASNVRAAVATEVKREVDRVNKAVDPDKWEMPPFMVNAYFHPMKTEIVFPSAILNPPFFSAPSKDNPYGDPAVNFGGIGAVICHEITHGFDDQGRKYDENGELNDWWSEKDATEYTKRAQLLVEQYNNYKVHDTFVQGELCLGENIADLGGVKLSHIGFQRFMKEHANAIPKEMDGLTMEQRFFCAWATIWRNVIRKEAALKRVVEDPHSPGEYRGNGPLELLDSFHKSFGVKEGDPMFRPKEKRCEIW